MTILLVEQNANFALDVSKRGYVLETGKVVDVRQLGRAADQPRSPEGVPRNMTALRAHRRHGAVAAVPLAAVRDRRLATCPSRKGYGEKPGLATGLLPARRSAIIVWLIVAGASRSRSGRRSAPFGRGENAAKRRHGADRA